MTIDADSPREDASPPLTRAVVSGTVGWGVTLAAVHKVGSVLVSLALVRLISAEAYGQFGLVNAILMFAYAFSMQRFMEHSFHAAGDPTSSYPDHLGFGIVLHLALFTGLNGVLLVAPLPPNYDAVRGFAHLGSVGILLNVPRTYYAVHLQRMLDWRRIRTLHLVSFVAGAVAALGLAFAGFGVVALLAQVIATPVPYIVDLVVRRPDLLRARFRLAGYGGTIRFGMLRNAGNLVWVGQRLVEASVFTVVAGFAGFGVYGRAVGLAGMTAGWLSEQMAAIAYPVLARLPARGSQTQRATGLVLRLALWTSAPLAASLYLFNETAVRLLYGPAWDEVAPLLHPVLVIAVAGAATRALGLVLLVTRGAGAALAVDSAFAAVCALGLWLALPGGPLAYAWFLAAGNGAVLVALSATLIATGVLRVRDLGAAAAPLLVLAGVAAVASTSGEIAARDSAGSPIGLCVTVALFLLATITTVRLLDADGLRDAVGFLPRGDQLTALLRIDNRSGGG